MYDAVGGIDALAGSSVPMRPLSVFTVTTLPEECSVAADTSSGKSPIDVVGSHAGAPVVGSSVTARTW